MVVLVVMYVVTIITKRLGSAQARPAPDVPLAMVPRRRRVVLVAAMVLVLVVMYVVTIIIAVMLSRRFCAYAPRRAHTMSLMICWPVAQTLAKSFPILREI